MISKEKKLNMLIKSWNRSKLPKTKKGLESVLKRTNDALASGWHASNKRNLEELRYIKYGLQEKLKGMK